MTKKEEAELDALEWRHAQILRGHLSPLCDDLTRLIELRTKKEVEKWGFRGGKIPSSLYPLFGDGFHDDSLDSLSRCVNIINRLCTNTIEITKEKKMKYTREDVITTKEQAEEVKLAVGTTVYGAMRPSVCVEGANKGNPCFKGTVEKIDWNSSTPFKIKPSTPNVFGPTYLDVECVIIKRGPVYKPLDLSNEEHRKMLRFRSIKEKKADPLHHREEFITVIKDDGVETDNYFVTPGRLVDEFVFADGPHKGEPVGIKED